MVGGAVIGVQGASDVAFGVEASDHHRPSIKHPVMARLDAPRVFTGALGEFLLTLEVGCDEGLVDGRSQRVHP